jgi:histidine triad (HIT) family protein
VPDNNDDMSPEDSAENCPFCGIVAGSLPSSQVYADPDVIAFLDIGPLTRGHLLVVPRRHAASLAALDERLGARLFTVAQRLAAAVRGSGLPCEGINLFLADGAVAGQEVFHVHLHVLPRTPGDGFAVSARRGGQALAPPSRAELDAAAALIRDSVGAAAAPHG